jgi:hypothetical protein
LAVVAKPFSPPQVGSARITPWSQTTPRQIFAVREGKKKRQLQVSSSGWAWSVSATPATRSIRFFEGQSTALLGPPSVPRSMGSFPFQSVA